MTIWNIWPNSRKKNNTSDNKKHVLSSSLICCKLWNVWAARDQLLISLVYTYYFNGRSFFFIYINIFHIHIYFHDVVSWNTCWFGALFHIAHAINILCTTISIFNDCLILLMYNLYIYTEVFPNIDIILQAFGTQIS